MTTMPTLTHADLGQLLPTLPTLIITDQTTEQEAMDAHRSLGWVDGALLGLVRFSGRTPWERHPAGDELLHVLDGEVELTILRDGGPERRVAATGSVCVVPKGLWHRQEPLGVVTLLFLTPTLGGECSTADDPCS